MTHTRDIVFERYRGYVIYRHVGTNVFFWWKNSTQIYKDITKIRKAIDEWIKQQSSSPDA